MSVRAIVFLSLLLFTSAPIIGMGRLGNSARLVARNVARLARLKTDSVRPKPLSKEVRVGDRGSITVSKEDERPGLLYTRYIHDRRREHCVTAFFYMCNKDKQYASLMCCINDYAKLLAHIQKSVQEGVEVCTQQGGVIEHTMAMQVAYEGIPQFTTAIHARKDVSEFVTKKDLAKSDESLLAKKELSTDSKQLLKMMKTIVYETSKNHDLVGCVTEKSYVEWDTHGFMIFLDPNQKNSYCDHVVEEKGRFLY